MAPGLQRHPFLNRISCLSLIGVFKGASKMWCRRALADPGSMVPENGGNARILFVGDVHDQWSDADVKAVEALKPDYTVFVGDIGNENVELVTKIAKDPFNKAVLLGNHDCFLTDYRASANDINTKDASERKRDNVDAQLEVLGNDHIGMSSTRLPAAQVTIVGGRPFSSGGNDWRRKRHFYKRLYGLSSERAFAEKIASTIMNAPEKDSILLVAHNGPSALGSRPEDICGVDFRRFKGGDWGDRDLRLAMDLAERNGRSPSLVAFGHMHSNLKGGGTRKRVAFESCPGILFLNTAVVPRVEELSQDGSLHHFCMVELSAHVVTEAKDIWVKVTLETVKIEHETVLFKRNTGEVESAWLLNTHTKRREPVQLVPPSNSINVLDSSASSGLSE